MLRDVFYFGKKPNAHPREKIAKNLKDARKQATTPDFWIINEFCDYRNFDWDFDFEFLPDEDVWAQDHNNVWPSQHQKDSGTWLCSKANSDVIIYRNDVDPVIRKNEITDNWKTYENIDIDKWDFSWHPDPTDPPYIYRWGCKFFPVQFKTCLEYHVPGATEVKYMDKIVELLPNWDCIKEYQKVDQSRWDMSWRPDPMDPPYIYVWGNKWIDGKLEPTLEYHAPGATEKKYMPELLAVLPETDRWVELADIDKTKFDYTWRPDPREPAYIYTWGNKWIEAELQPTLEYHCQGATERKYMGNDIPVLPQWDRWNILQDIDKTKFDFTWRPDPREPAFIYVFGNQLYDAVKQPTIEYHCEGATQRKYMDSPVASLAASPKLYEHLEDSYLLDYTWLPDPDSPPYIYAWGNQWNKPEDKISVQLVVDGATEYKYMSERAVRKPCMDNWVVPDNIDTTGFDFSWEPSPAEPPYIYEFGTQWQKTGGPRYVVEGATEVKYIGIQKAKALSDKSNWTVPANLDIDGFDFSWHPDSTSPPYIYIFPTQWALTGGPVYTCEGATEKKYVEYPTAIALPNKENWEIPDDIDVDAFDWSWHPYAEDDPCIYQIGTQWQKTGGPRYHVPGTDEMSPIKYIDTRIIKAKKLPDQKYFTVLEDYRIDTTDFDWSWHPDETEQPYIYVFGNQHYSAEKMPTMEYRVPGASQYKFLEEPRVKLLEDRTNWIINHPIDESSIDFSWRPDPGEPPYIYTWGNQHYSAESMPTVEYHTPGATERKYIGEDWYAKLAPQPSAFTLLEDCTDVDYTWRPDLGAPPYIYAWGNQWNKPEDKISVQYVVEGATEYKYMNDRVKRKPCKDNWFVPDHIDTTGFDFSWEPSPAEPPYIYEFGTQWQPNGGPRYVVPGATEIKYINVTKAKKLPNKANWIIPASVDISEFDFSWHPDNTSPDYQYVFGTQWQKTGGPIYNAGKFRDKKFVEFPVARALPNRSNWLIPQSIAVDEFDFSWHPCTEDDPCIYQIGTQHQKTGGPRYVTPGTDNNSPVKYISTEIIKSRRLPNKTNFNLVDNDFVIEQFDYSWHPDDTEQPYIYVFGNQHYTSEIMPTIEYKTDGATQYKYVSDIIAVLGKDMKHWEVPENLDTTDFDFSWKPNPYDPPYIYETATQWQKSGGPRYLTPGATEVKYVDSRLLHSKHKVDRAKFAILNNYKIKEFDYSWHPDATEKPYIYVFGNNQYPGEMMPTIEYAVPGATEVKYIPDAVLRATLDTDYSNWLIPANIDKTSFDFSWKPNPKDPEYIYEFPTQWNDRGGPKYIVGDATEYKYVDSQAAKLLPNKDNWTIPDNVELDQFDFSWVPHPEDPPYVYHFGTQWQKTGGPKYVVSGATDIKYVDVQKVKALPTKENWVLPKNCDVSDFDFSWHPDETSPPYIYHFPTQWALTGGPMYVVPGAEEAKYIEFPVAKATPDRTNWVIPDYIDAASFDFSWHPYIEDQPYIYQFGTQHQKTGGPRYVTPGVIPTSPIKYIDTRIIKSKRLPDKSKFAILDNLVIDDFDWSWHPDDTEEPFIYIFGNNQYPAEIMPTIEYVVPGAKQIKYVQDVVAKLGVDKKNWYIPDNIDVTGFDFSWKPNPKDPLFIYEFGTQWQKTGGPRYLTPGAVDVKYIDTMKVKALPCMDNWTIPPNVEVTNFDFSWHPDSTSPPYTYHFATQWALTGGPIYNMEGAKETKYMENPVALALPNKANWQVPDDIDTEYFDFSWHPYIEDQPYVYQFGTQHQKTGGPRYVTPGVIPTSPIKYIDTRILKGTKLPNKKKFAILNNLVIKDFDYSWHPDETEQPYIYVFGNNQYPAEIMPTVEYAMPGAKEVKYVNDIVATLGPDMKNWEVPEGIDVSDFDFSWKPNPKDPLFIYEFGTQWQKTGGPRYVVPGAVDVKYIDTQKAKALPKMDNWTIPKNVDVTGFDFSWHPDATSPPYTYNFATQWALTGGPIYNMDGAQETKYMEHPMAKALPDRTNWVIPDDIAVDEFDFSWHPYIEDQPYVYQFGTQWQKTGGPKYVTPGVIPTSPIKYIDTRILKARKLPNRKNFAVLRNLKIKDFDYSWHPDETEQPYIYIFGNKHHSAEQMPTLEYKVGDAKQVKYVEEPVATLQTDMTNWIIPKDLDVSEFDFSWKPGSFEPELYVYEFGTQWQLNGGPRYVTPGAKEVKYISSQKAKALPNMDFWKIPKGVDVSWFDFSWHPDNTAPSYIYQFASLEAEANGPVYATPGATEVQYIKGILKKPDEPVKVVEKPKEEIKKAPKGIARYFIKSTLENLIKEHPNETFWALNPDIDYNNFDFTWSPDTAKLNYVHAFGSAENINTQTYYVNSTLYDMGFKEINYVEDQKLELQTVIDIFFVDRGNPESADRFDKLKAQHGSRIQKTRYLNSWVDTINRCINRSTTNLCWILNSELDYSTFDFNYYPNPWQMKMVHVFGTQWSHWGTTFMVNRETFSQDTKYIKIIEHLSNLNFVKDKKAIATNNLYDIVMIDHGNKDVERVIKSIASRASGKTISTVKYEENYYKTMQKIVNAQPAKKDHYIWICSSICNYGEFDFTYICDPFAKDHLHVFPSDRQKFGDTFLIDVNKTREQLKEIDILQTYHKVNYNQTMRAKRLSAPVIKVTDDTHVDAVKNHEFDFPYAIFTTEDIDAVDAEPMSLWTEDSKNIQLTSTGNTRIIVPREVNDYLEDELYDYPYIKTASRLALSKPLDIVFLSNGESIADENYEHLLSITKGLKNRIVRVDGVKGRVQAYHAALEASETPWAFTVFAKLKVDTKFDFNWQPDRLQVPKHYIFHAKNPVNGLEYGHQGMIAYNKKLTLANKGKGLDFTLDDPHETVEILSGIAKFNTDKFSTWRTAFREVIKLKSDYTDISEQRLNTWLNDAEGDYAEDCLRGAKDAAEYYKEVSGDIDKLKLSYEWDWLAKFYKKKYK